MEISKELLSELLEYKVYDYTLKNTNIKLNKITASTLCDEPRIIGYEKGINIYELAHKCKEWALSKEYKLLSMSKECFLYDTKELYDVSEQLNQWAEWFDAETEVEAIFKACEWILNNKPL